MLGFHSRGFRLLGGLALLAALWLTSVRSEPEARAAEEAPELSMIPPDAAGFLTVSFAEVWETPALKEVRKMVDNLKGDDYLRQTVGLRLHEIERVTLLFPSMPHLFSGGPNFSVIVTTKKPYDKVKILDALEAFSPAERNAIPGRDGDQFFPIAPKLAPALPPIPVKEAKEPSLPNGGGLDEKDKDDGERDLSAVIYFSDIGRTTILFVGERTVMFSPGGEQNFNLATHLALLLRKGKNGKLAPALAAAKGKHHAVGGLDLSQVKRRLGRDVPEDFPGSGLLGASAITFKLELAGEMRVTLTLDTHDAKTAKEVEGSVKEMLQLVTEALPEAKKRFGRNESGKALLPALDQLADALKAATVKVEEKSVAVGLSMKSDNLFAGLLAHGVSQVRRSAERVRFINNFKQLALAMHNFHDVYGHCPFPGYDKKGQIAENFDAAKLSWRVALLPYIEEDNLFRQFKLNEPWDSEHNKKLIPLMPKIYAARKEVNLKEGHTFVQIFQGPDALKPRSSLIGVTDGTSNTIFFAEAGEGVIWTKPDDMKFDVNKELPKLGGNFDGDFIVAMGDGSVRFVTRKKVSDATLKLLIQPADGNVIPGDWEE
jgi:hypothetical protein